MYNKIDYTKRIKIMFGFIVFVFLALIGKLSYIKIYERNELSVITEKQYSVVENTKDINFKLLDTNLNNVLSTKTKYYCTIDVDSFKQNNQDTSIENIKTLMYILKNYDKSYDLDSLIELHPSEKVYYEVDNSTYVKLNDNIKDIKGVYCFYKDEVDRTYPWKYENMLTSFVDADNKDKDSDSIEMYIKNKTKNNQFEGIEFEKNLSGQYIKSDSEDFTSNGNVNVVLTVNSDFEKDIKEVISKDQYKKYDQIGVILGDPSNGEILGMVQRDDWKPNINLCSATDNGYEPGSIFKTITFEAAIEEGKIPLNYELTCDGENCYSVHGTLNLENAYIKSCNSYFGQLGEIIRFENILPIAKKQGIFSKVLNFSGNEEVTGDYYYEKKPKDIVDGSERILAFGQSMRITPIQALGMVNTVVNDGKYIKPHLIKSLVHNNNEVIENEEIYEEKVIKSSTANILKNEMLKVVREDELRSAYSDIYEIGGKTGTNTRIEDGVEHSDGWFTGYAKINNKYYTMVVFVKNIDEKEWGRSTAAPIFKEIIEKIGDKIN